jgi:cytidylate kinase
MRIIVSGLPKAGKTTVSDLLAAELGYKQFYAGGIFKKMAAALGKDINQFYREVAKNPELELRIDTEQEKFIRNNDNIVVQGRIAPFLAPEIPKVKVFLKIDLIEAARRQAKEKNDKRTLFEIAVSLGERIAEERTHYAKLRELYGGFYNNFEDHLDEKKFDIVIDTTFMNEQKTFETIKREIKKINPDL